MAKEATEAVSASNEQMQQLMESMRSIDAKSRGIRSIIKTIEDIAFQTNILALNAAVEAAHDITELIESSVKAIHCSVELAQGTAGNLLQVVDGAHETTAVIVEIANATKAQAQAVSQITIGIDQISSVVQQNSATSEESAAASEELSGQAQMMKKLVGRFILNNPGGHLPPANISLKLSQNIPDGFPCNEEAGNRRYEGDASGDATFLCGFHRRAGRGEGRFFGIKDF